MQSNHNLAYVQSLEKRVDELSARLQEYTISPNRYVVVHFEGQLGENCMVKAAGPFSYFDALAHQKRVQTGVVVALKKVE